MRHIEVSAAISPSRHLSAGYKIFRAAAAVATGELPSVTEPPQVQCHAPVFIPTLFPFFFSFLYYASVPDIIIILSIFNPLPLPWSLLLSKFASSGPNSPDHPLSTNLISISFLPPPSYSVFLHLFIYFTSSGA